MLSTNIKKFRKKSKLSQEELAKKTDITYSTILKIESGVNKNPTLETLSLRRPMKDTKLREVNSSEIGLKVKESISSE